MTATTRTLSRTALAEICEYTEIDTDGITDAYGPGHRGTEGGECFGVILPRESVHRFLIALGALLTEAALARDDDTPTEQAFELGESVRTDNLGPGNMIVYFPGWQLG